MAESSIAELEIKPSIEVVRYSEQDQPEDDPYANFSAEGFYLFKDLIAQLRAKYPGRQFPNEEIIERINPEKTEGKHLATYLAYDGDEPIGGVIGEDFISYLKGLWLVVDPSYQRGVTARKLIEAVGNDYQKITLLASTFAGKKEASEEKQIARQQALVEYYKRLGFTEDTTAETYRYSHIPGAPVPMVWHKTT